MNRKDKIELEKIYDNLLNKIDYLAHSNKKSTKNVGAKWQNMSPNSRCSSHLRYFTPEKQEYYRRLSEFNRVFNYKKAFGDRWKLYKHIARLTIQGRGPTYVAQKLNNIYGLSLHKDSYARYLRWYIGPAMRKWYRHSHNLPGPGLFGVRPPENLRRPGRSARYYTATTAAQKNMAISNINDLRASKRIPLP